MNLTEKIYMYCERGGNPAFWAEPLNAISNGAFIIAALVAAAQFARTPQAARGLPEAALIALVFVIGVGSFLFHTYATRWASLADIIPIGVFMLAYFAYVLRRFVRLNWVLVAAGLAIFVWSLRYAATIQCPAQEALLPITAAARGRCLNGTIAYVPAFIALAGSGMLLALLRHPAWRYLAGAAVLFAASMTARTLDFELCELARAGTRVLGTHFMWHILNAATLYLLTLAAIRHGHDQHRKGVV